MEATPCPAGGPQRQRGLAAGRGSPAPLGSARLQDHRTGVAHQADPACGAAASPQRRSTHEQVLFSKVSIHLKPL